MKKARPPKDKKPQEPIMSDWCRSATEEDKKNCWVPVARRFQADVPALANLPDMEKFRISYMKDTHMNCLKNRVWPSGFGAPEEAGERIGAGRPDVCDCNKPGSIECVRRHITDKRNNLRTEIKFTFFAWGFDKMGEDVSQQWNDEEQLKFESLVKLNPISQGKSFLEPAIESIPTKNRKAIVNYYLNVYLLRRMRTQIRSGNYIVETDDEEEATSSSKRSRRKRSRDKKPVNTKYLTGR